MKVLKVVVITGRPNVDKLYIRTDLPQPFATHKKHSVELEIECTSGDGEEYARKHFQDVEIEVIDCRIGGIR